MEAESTEPQQPETQPDDDATAEEKPRKPRSRGRKKKTEEAPDKFESPIDTDNGYEEDTEEPNVIDEGHSIQLDLFGNPM